MSNSANLKRATAVRHARHKAQLESSREIRVTARLGLAFDSGIGCNLDMHQNATRHPDILWIIHHKQASAQNVRMRLSRKLAVPDMLFVERHASKPDNRSWNTSLTR